MGAGRIVRRRVFFLLIWVRVTFTPSPRRAACASPLPCARAANHSAYVPEPGGPWSAPCPAALLSAFLLCLHTYLLPFLRAYPPAAPLCVPPGTSPHTRLRLLAASSPGQAELGQFLTPGTALGSEDTHALGRQSTPSRRAASLLGGQRSPPRALDTNKATRSHGGGTGPT